MLDTKILGEKLRAHRKNCAMTQEEAAARIGVTAQAISKWELGECLPDCFNLKAIGETYGVSLDILLDTDAPAGDVQTAAGRIEQIADEFIWAKSSRDKNAHRDLGDDLWQMWKGIYFVEVGNKEHQNRDKERGNLRVCSDYGMKIWDDEGVACVVQSALRDRLETVTDRELEILRTLCTPEGFALLRQLDPNTLTPKSELSEKTGIEEHALNDLLLTLTEAGVAEFVYGSASDCGYKMSGHFGIAGYMMLAAAFVLAKHTYTISEYTNRWE